MRIRDIINENSLKNGTFENAFSKLIQGYKEGRNSNINTCYNWVGYFLKNNPEYDNINTILRFWGIRRSPLSSSLIVHGDAISPFLKNESVLSDDARLQNANLLISTSPDSDYSKMQLVAEIAWLDFKLKYLT